MTEQIQALTLSLHTQGAVALKSMRALDDMRTRLGEVEAEVEGLRATMLDMQGRHIEQINRCVFV